MPWCQGRRAGSAQPRQASTARTFDFSLRALSSSCDSASAACVRTLSACSAMHRNFSTCGWQGGTGGKERHRGGRQGGGSCAVRSARGGGGGGGASPRGLCTAAASGPRRASGDVSGGALLLLAVNGLGPTASLPPWATSPSRTSDHATNSSSGQTASLRGMVQPAENRVLSSAAFAWRYFTKALSISHSTVLCIKRQETGRRGGGCQRPRA